MKKIFKAMLFACLTFTSLVGCDTKDEKGTNNGDNNSTENKVEAKLTGITLDTTNVKKAYTYGEVLNLTGLVVNGSYDDNTSKAVTGYTTNPANGAALNSVGDVPVTVTYEEKTASFNVTVGKTLTGITLETTNAKKAYTYGDALDVTGLVVKANYNDNSSEAISDYTVSPTAGTTLTTAGDNTVTVTYSGLTETYKVTVDKTPTGIELDTANVKKDYIYGDKFTSAGLGVSAVYANGVKEAITSGYTVSVDDNADLLTSGNQEVTVTYGTLTGKYTINVDKTATSITANANNVKQNYKVGEKLDLTGLVVTANYSNGYSEEIDTYTTSTEDKATLSTGGEFDLVVSYGTLTDSFKVTVTKAPATMDVDTTKAKMSYNRGDELNLSKIEVKIIYDDGTSEVVKNYNQSISNGTVLTSDTGSQDVVITYGNLTKTLTVVVDKGIIYLDQSSVKSDYSYGDTLDLDGIRFYNEFSDGTKKYVDVLSTDPVDGTVLNSVGWIYIKANYIDVVGAEALVSVGFYVKALNETSTHLTLNLDESPAHLYGKEYDSKRAVGTPGSNYTPEFHFYEGTPNSNSFEIVNGKMRFNKWDEIQNVTSLGGVTKIRVNSNITSIRLFAGYSANNMHEFLSYTADSGACVFDNIPHMNYFRIIANSDNMYISSIEFDYTRDANNNLVDGQEIPFSEVNINNGVYYKNADKNSYELNVSDNTITFNGLTFYFSGVKYNDYYLYSYDLLTNLLVKNLDNFNMDVIYTADDLAFASGDYSIVSEPTIINLYVDNEITDSNTAATRKTIDVGEAFKFEAFTDAYPQETVNVELIDETHIGLTDSYIGEYVADPNAVLSDFEYNDYPLSITSVLVTERGGKYHVAYTDGGCGEYAGLDDDFEATASNGTLSFGEGNMEITINTNSKKIEYEYFDYSENVFYTGEVSYTFTTTLKETANFKNGVVTGVTEGNCYLKATTSNNLVSYYYIHVNEYVPADDIVVASPTNVSLNKGETAQIEANANSDATNKTLSYSSSDKSVATVDDTGLITAIKGGQAIITISTVDDCSIEINVTVVDNTPVSLTGTFTFEDDLMTCTLVVEEDSAELNSWAFTKNGDRYEFEYDPDVYFTIESVNGSVVMHFYDAYSTLSNYGVWSMYDTEGTITLS